MSVGILRPRLCSAALLSVCAALCFAGPARAKPPAPGAPGAIHVWAPADKHGFGTAHELASNAWFTLRQGSLSEIYYPDLSTPGFRGLQFAVSDGDKLLQRETVDDDPRHIEPLADGVTSRVEPLAGSLGFRQVTAGHRLAPDQDVDHRSGAPGGARAGPLRVAERQAAAALRPGGSRAGQRRQRRPRDQHRQQLVAYDDVAASAVAATPAFTATTSGYRGTASDPWKDLEADRSLSEYDATKPGNVVQGARTALTGQRGSQDMTLAIGFGSNASGAGTAAADSLAAGFTAAQTAFNAGWAGYRATLKPRARERQLRRAAAQPLRAVAARPGRVGGQAHQPRRVDRGAEHGMDLGHARRSSPSAASPARTTSCGRATSTTSPRRRRRPATTRRPAGCSTSCGRCRRRTARSGRTRASTARRSGRRSRWTRCRSRSCSPGGSAARARRTGRTSSAPPTMSSPTVRRTDNERWENQGGYSPNTIATEIAGLICAAAIARDERRAGARRPRTSGSPTPASSSVEGWTATQNGPYSPRPYYLRVTKDGKPNAGTTYGLGDNFNRPVDQREIVDNSFLGLVLFGVKKWNDQTVLNSLKVGDETSAYPLKVDTPSGPVWHRFTFDGYGEQADGGDWDLFFDNPARQTRGRLWPLLTGERGEYELIAGRSAGSVPRHDRQHRERRADAARAGLGRPAAARRAVRQGHALRDAAGVDARPVRAAGVVDRRRHARSSARRSSPAATSRSCARELSRRRPEVLR